MRLHRVLDGHLIHAGNLCTGYCFHVGQVDPAPEARRFPCEVVETAQQIPVHDERAGLATVLCSTIGDLLECHHPSLTPVYFCESELSVEAMLQALANGAADCWAVSMSAEQLRERADALLNRVEQKLATGLRAEGDDQHAAARLSTLEQELQEDQRAGQSIQLGMLLNRTKSWPDTGFRDGYSPR